MNEYMIGLTHVFAHGAAGAWDEIIPITVAVLTTVLGAAVFIAARRFRAEENDSEDSSG